MSEARKAIIISTGMDNLVLIEKLQQSETLTGASLNRIKALYEKFNEQKLAIEERANQASWARYQANLEKKAAADAVFFKNQSAMYAERDAVAGVAAGSIPANMVRSGEGVVKREGKNELIKDSLLIGSGAVGTRLPMMGPLRAAFATFRETLMGSSRAVFSFGRTLLLMGATVAAWAAAILVPVAVITGLPGYKTWQAYKGGKQSGLDVETASAQAGESLKETIQMMQHAGLLDKKTAAAYLRQLKKPTYENVTAIQLATNKLMPAGGLDVLAAMPEKARLDAQHMEKYMAAQRENWTLQQRLNADLNAQHVIKMQMAKLDKDSLEYKKLQLELDDAILAAEKDSKALASQRASLLEQYQRNQKSIRREMNSEAGTDLMGIPSLESSVGRDYAAMLKNQYGEWNSAPVQRMAQAYLRQQYGMGYDFEQFSLATGGDYSAWLTTAQGAGEKRYLKQLAGPLEALGIVKDADLAGRLDELTKVNQDILEKLSHIGIEE